MYPLWFLYLKTLYNIQHAYKQYPKALLKLVLFLPKFHIFFLVYFPIHASFKNEINQFFLRLSEGKMIQQKSKINAIF